MPIRLDSVTDNLPHLQRVRTFTALVEQAGRLFHDVQHEELLFRGQDALVLNDDGSHAVKPRLYRGGEVSLETVKRLEHRIRALDHTIYLNRQYAWSNFGCEALFAHYERYDTRMLDCTHVLQVAASFAIPAQGTSMLRPAVVYALDVRGATPKPKPGKLGRILVNATAGQAALRPMRQAAWAIWQHQSEARLVDFGGLVRAAFVIAPEDHATFWDCTTPYPYSWLMESDDVAKALRRP